MKKHENNRKEALAQQLAEKAEQVFPVGLVKRRRKVSAVADPKRQLHPAKALKPS